MLPLQMADSDFTYDELPAGKTPSVVTSGGVHLSATQKLKGMKPGDSFIVDSKRGRASVISAAWRLDIPITVRKEGTKFNVTRLP